MKTGMHVTTGKGLLPALAVLVMLAGLAGALPAASSGEGLGRQEMEDRLREGEEAFRQGMSLDSSDPAAAADYYRRAILNFEHIVSEGGVRNGKLYYNIGNAWFRLDDLGRAILNYKRARMLRPNDQNLVQNLEYARSRRVNRVETAERERVFKTLFFFHYDIPSRVRLGLFAGFFALIWVAAGLHIFIRRGWLKVLVVVFSALSAIFISSLAVDRAVRINKPEGVIVAGEVVARKGDAETYQPSFTDPLSSGTEFRLLEKRAEWWHIELEDGAGCWIPAVAGELVIDW
ncbi:MAG TPA: tetratricopeptide repeat protein [Candidatus Krumholzibacterium sp.]|nr:tetratricopeptide repeat protein [Candidatus Krumholzibacterium sp.]